MEGTCTGEHGIGIVKKDYLLQELGVDTINTMKVIKRALDPDLLMNPVRVGSTNSTSLELTYSRAKYSICRHLSGQACIILPLRARKSKPMLLMTKSMLFTFFSSPLLLRFVI
jgi:hypothetical protein